MTESVSQVYVLDDDVSVREAVGGLIRSAGLCVKTFASAQETLASLRKELPSCLVLDIQLPDINGLELQRELVSKDIQMPIIFLTGHGDIPMSVRAIKAGALEFLTKPFDDEYLLEAIREAIARPSKVGRSQGSIGADRCEDDSGTNLASRAMPDQAEIGEIPLEMQSKLLRVLQEKCYERVGEERTRRADVRIIAATNRYLKKEVIANRFREDLYYRLNVFPIRLAPLRDRAEDIPLLAKHFVELSLRELGCPRPRLTQAGIQALLGYDWPGNIRELRSVIERAIIFARGGALDFDLPVVHSSSDRTPTASRLEDRETWNTSRIQKCNAWNARTFLLCWKRPAGKSKVLMAQRSFWV